MLDILIRQYKADENLRNDPLFVERLHAAAEREGRENEIKTLLIYAYFPELSFYQWSIQKLTNDLLDEKYVSDATLAPQMLKAIKDKSQGFLTTLESYALDNDADTLRAYQLNLEAYRVENGDEEARKYGLYGDLLSVRVGIEELDQDVDEETEFFTVGCDFISGYLTDYIKQIFIRYDQSKKNVKYIESHNYGHFTKAQLRSLFWHGINQRNTIDNMFFFAVNNMANIYATTRDGILAQFEEETGIEMQPMREYKRGQPTE